jgi:predicted ATPase/class 3 adenylate cyclase
VLPTGTVTFLFTDIEGSTRLWEEHTKEMQAALGRHDNLLHVTITEHRGHVFKTVGDAFHAAFPTASDAVAAALDAQRALTLERWALPGGLRVRMALDTGVAEQRNGDYFGPTLNRAARLLGVGHGGQILLFSTTYGLVQDALPADVMLRNLGQHRLRDLGRPEQIYQLVAPGVVADFPSLRSLDTFPHNLPVQLTSFIGREREISEVKALLSTARLLTLTGAGGAGKTRLALQVAADLVDDEFGDGVWLAEFAALADPALVPQTVAASLGLREHSERAILPILTDFLQFKHVLLVMDNCEHVVAECARLTDHLLRASPDIRILATSQTTLGVPGEVAYGVPPFALPDPRPAPSVEHLSQFEAVRLFVERARLNRPGFAVTSDNAAAVAQVVHQLDGIPLAIELAAARAKVMSVQQISERLEDRFRLLSTGGRTAAPRHQTLKAAMDWSYDLLAEPERTLLRRLVVFAGGWTLEAAEAICAGGDVESSQVLDLLAGLVDRSLALVEEVSGGAIRYRLLETVRLYGRERLRASREEERTRTRHRDWFLVLAEQAEGHLQGPEAPAWLDRLETEHDNLRVALEWCKMVEGDAEYWLRLAGALWRFWDMRGYWSEGRAWLDGALAQTAGMSTPGRLKVIIAVAYLASFQGDYDRAVALSEESLDLSQRLGDTRGTVSCLNILGMDACRLEKYDRAAELGKESLVLSQEVGDWWGAFEARVVLAVVARAQGDFERASTLLEEIVLRIRQVGDKWRLAVALNYLGLVKRELGDYARATALLEETLALAQELGDKWGVAFAQSNLAIVAWYREDYPQAADRFAKSLRLRVEVGEKRGIVTSLLGLAAVAAAQGDAERAAMLFSAAEVLREAIGVPLPPFIRSNFEQHVADTRAALGEGRFVEIWAKGRTLTLDAAIAYALMEASTVS